MTFFPYTSPGPVCGHLSRLPNTRPCFKFATDGSSAELTSSMKQLVSSLFNSTPLCENGCRARPTDLGNALCDYPMYYYIQHENPENLPRILFACLTRMCLSVSAQTLHTALAS